MKTRLTLALLVLMLAAMACNVPSAMRRTTGTPDEVGQMLTQVAQTVAAELTRTPAGTQGAPTATLAAGSPTVFPTLALLPTATLAGDTSAEATEALCDKAAFVTDVTVPDGTRMTPGQTFTKTWRLKNTGTCTWTTGYAVVFVQGDAMGAPAAVALAGPVAPDATVDLSVEMKAPTLDGSYTGYWRLRNAAGMQFGTGADQPFFVQIEVGSGTPAAGVNTLTVTPTSTRTATARPTTAGTQGALFSLGDNYCQAEWRTQAGTLACPGMQGDNSGYVVRLTNPQLEDGQTETRAVLLTAPNKVTDGAITGRFPARPIEAGTRFRAKLGCLNGAAGCAVVYQLNYIIGSSSPASLGQWAHTYGTAMPEIDVDLTPLAGRSVELILAVLANGPSEGDQAVWVDPRIEKAP